jgi:hypothetical protein
MEALPLISKTTSIMATTTKASNFHTLSKAEQKKLESALLKSKNQVLLKKLKGETINPKAVKNPIKKNPKAEIDPMVFLFKASLLFVAVIGFIYIFNNFKPTN